MEHWLDFEILEQVLLWDLMRHELAVATLGQEWHDRPGRDLGRDARATAPRIQGSIILHEMRSNPQVVSTLLQEKKPPLRKVELSSYHFCYWHNTSNEIDILELDALGYYLLALIDGKRSIAVLSRMLSGSRKAARGTMRALNELAELGIICNV
jgi:hypothetical protein